MRILSSITLVCVLGFSSFGMADEISDLTAKAEAGDASAQYSLGMMYATGEGVPQNYQQAVYWWQKAAERGKAAAQFDLGVMYANGEGVTQDFVQAHKWWNIASTNGHQKAREYRGSLANEMTPGQITEAQRLAKEWMKSHQ